MLTVVVMATAIWLRSTTLKWLVPASSLTAASWFHLPPYFVTFWVVSSLSIALRQHPHHLHTETHAVMP